MGTMEESNRPEIKILRYSNPLRDAINTARLARIDEEITEAKKAMGIDNRGEQPENPIDSEPGALRGEHPLSEETKE